MMSRAEAKRYAHKLAADALAHVVQELSEPVLKNSGDGQLVLVAAEAIIEQHLRFGPKTTDRAPTFKRIHETPLLDVLENYSPLNFDAPAGP